MKRAFIYGSLIALLAAGVYAGSSSTITVTPSDMKDGDVKTFTDDGKTITIKRDGDTTNIKIEGAGETKTLAITKADGTIRIVRDGEDGRAMIFGPDRHRIVINGHALDTMELPKFKHPGTVTFYVCPKDHTTLHVPSGSAKDDATFKCPVDGTTMEKRKTHGFSFFFDDDTFDGDI